MHIDGIQDLEVLLGHSFRDKEFLLNAICHSSIKTDDRPSNERLEFLGDSVLGTIISEALYRRFPDDDEGTLTRIKSQAVSRATLQRVANAMGLDRYIRVGKGVAKREIPASLLGNLFEAIVGAIYLDSGLISARKFILRHLDIVIEEIVQDRAEKNYKSLLQQHCQREVGAVPMYRLIREAGPAHSRAFDVAVVVGGKEYGRARGASKKEAEQGSARAAMIYMKAVRESARQPVRGAGTILRVGPDSDGRKSRNKPSGRRRGARGGNGAAAQPAARPSRGRRRSKAASAAPAEEAKSEAPRKKTARKKRMPTPRKSDPAKSKATPAKKPSRRRGRRKKTTKPPSDG